MRPKKFVSLHNHTCFSPFDGLGYPEDHFRWCKDNGLDAHAITDHGNFNSYAHSELFVQEWKKSGTDFKYLPGIEAYFHPDLAQWKLDKEQAEQKKKDEKETKKAHKKLLEENKTLVLASVDSDDETLQIETHNALTIENEDESKSTKYFNPVNRRHHLVLLPKNSQGLQELFHLTSRSFKEGFYRFPRIDLPMLRETLTKGNVMASSACLHPDSIVHTNYGQLTIKDAVEKHRLGCDVLVLSYSTDDKRSSFQRVIWGDVTRKNAKLVCIKLKNGKTLKLTPDHKVYTRDGWKEAKDLRKTDAILSIHR